MDTIIVANFTINTAENRDRMVEGRGFFSTRLLIYFEC